MEDESSYRWGMDIDGRWHRWVQIGGEDLLYSNSDCICEERDCPNPPQRPEEISLHWQDGSVTEIQMYRPPDGRPGIDESKAEEFYIAIQEVLHEFFGGRSSAGIEARNDKLGDLYFDTFDVPEREQGRMQSD